MRPYLPLAIRSKRPTQTGREGDAMHRQDNHWLPLSAPAAQLWALDDVVRDRRNRRRRRWRLSHAVLRVVAVVAAIAVRLAQPRTARLNER
jgi:hypothetical protein